MLSDDISLALVLTTNNATISACIAKSVVTQGNFSGFCLRFANDFQPWLDDWRDESYYDRNIVDIASDYDMAEFCYGVVINAFTVPQGSYKVICSLCTYKGVLVQTRFSQTGGDFSKFGGND